MYTHDFISAWITNILYVGCLKNEYAAPGNVTGLEICAPCPANSTSEGGDATDCTCDLGTGRVNDNDVTQPCLGE